MQLASARPLGKRPALTGLRAVAIAIVVARHAGEAAGVGAFSFGFAGVDIFFVLSGFLITSLLVGEHSRTGRVSLPEFYVRRAFRLLPALAAFLVAMLALATIVQPASLRRPLLHAVWISALFVGNIAKTLHRSEFVLPHMWSLGMEEQFYLVWPVLLVALLWLRAPRSLVLTVAVAGAALVAGTRIALSVSGSASAKTLFYSPLHSDGLLLGCALGLAYAWRILPRPETVRRLLLPAVPIAAAVLLLVSIRGAPYSGWGMTVGLFVIAAAGVVLVYAAIDERPVLPIRFLIWRPVIYLGEISYALYIWHFAVLTLWPATRFSVLTRIVISLVLAVASYELVEKPFLRRKRRHTPAGTDETASVEDGVVAAGEPAGLRSR
ncbi:MAG TPA: acyltransferase [Gaiellaceae bacterium]